MTLRAMILAILISTAPLPLAAQDAPDIVGVWEGALAVQGLKLRLALKVKRTDAGLSATLDSIDQGAHDLVVDEIAFAEGKLTFSMNKLGATYTGALSRDGKSFDGTFTQGGAKLPLVLARVAAASKLERPQEPKPPFPYAAHDVSFAHEKATLAGTLTLPKGAGPHPAVVLISGSGPQDRDESLLGHRPFLVIADHLTRRGIAVLRYDDRGIGKSKGDFAGSTSADFAEDALAAVKFLAAREDIDAKRIGLAGHSEGGLIAPMVAARAPGSVAFCVLMAGTGVRGTEILRLQGRLIQAAGGDTKERIERDDKLRARAYALIVAKDRPEDWQAKLTAMFVAYFETLEADEQKAVGGDATAWAAGQVKTLSSPWFQYFMGFDPATTLAQTRCPVLAINGAVDLQVDAAQNLPAIGAALSKGGNTDVTLVTLPALNHLFQRSKTGSPSEYAQLTETFSPLALRTISDWIVLRFGAPPK